MEKKRVLFSEVAYVLGILTLAMGTAMMERADFGMSMVVAPAYLFHLKISETFSWFTFGMAEYCLQAVLLTAISLVLRKFKPMYLLSFGTAVIYGLVLDFCIFLIGLIPGNGLSSRLAFYVAGLMLCAFGVAMLFHTYIAPEAYELLVKEISSFFRKDISKVKTGYDCISCVLAIILSFVFFGFGHFEGVKLGTIICALINGWLIGKISKLLEKKFIFRDVLKLRKIYQ